MKKRDLKTHLRGKRKVWSWRALLVRQRRRTVGSATRIRSLPFPSLVGRSLGIWKGKKREIVTFSQLKGTRRRIGTFIRNSLDDLRRYKNSIGILSFGVNQAADFYH